jgi:hypothetical protein
MVSLSPESVRLVSSAEESGRTLSMKTTMLKVALALAVGGIAYAQQQALFIPQVVDGGGWQTTFALTNRTANPASISLNFRIDTTAGATQPWTPPLLEVSSTAGLVLSGGSTMYLHTPGTAANLSQGWVVVNADPGIVAYAIFTFRTSGRSDQDNTTIAAASATRILVPFDNSSGFMTAVGVANPMGTSQIISVNFRSVNGAVIQGSVPSIPPNGHLEFTLPQQFPAIAGQSGLAEFYSTSGSFSLFALRYNPTVAFTSAPVYFEAGPPVISSGNPPPAVTIGPGEYLVGTAVPAGRYYTVPANGCYWERLSGLGGTLGEIIANDFISGYGQAIVDIKASDLAFSTNTACGTWSNSPTVGVQGAIPSGTWLVGAQIASGTYQANASSGCYWERLRDFSGSLSAIVANNFVSTAGPQLVSIAATDVGVTTESSCGVWTRISSQLDGPSTQTSTEIKRNLTMRRSQNARLQTPIGER